MPWQEALLSGVCGQTLAPARDWGSKMMTEKAQWQVRNGSSERGLPPLTESKPHVLDVKPSLLRTGSCLLELDSGSGQSLWLLRKTVLGVTLNHQYCLAGSIHLVSFPRCEVWAHLHPVSLPRTFKHFSSSFSQALLGRGICMTSRSTEKKTVALGPAPVQPTLRVLFNQGKICYS